jgi:osmoprotectant transport system permease protein
VWEFLVDQRIQLLYQGYQHVSLVLQAVALATVIALVVAIAITRVPALDPVANAVSAIGLTVPSLALLGLFLPMFGLGVPAAFAAVTFYAILPILRNAVVGIAGVDKNLMESAQGMGMTAVTRLIRVQLPLAWPVIVAGIRVSTQMSMGVAAIAAFVKGPGYGTFIFSGLARIGGEGAVASALVGTLGVVVLALLVDAVLMLFARLTTSKGIRV